MAKTRYLIQALCLGACMASPLAHAGSQLALEKGCYACHGKMPQQNAPTFESLAAHFAPSRQSKGQAEAEKKLIEEIRSINVVAHQQLSDESARVLARWILDGAR